MMVSSNFDKHLHKAAFLFYVSTISFIIIGIVLNLRGFSKSANSYNVQVDMMSTIYRDSLVATISVSILMIFQLCIECISRNCKYCLFYGLRVLILVIVAVPDVITLSSKARNMYAINAIFLFKVVLFHAVGQVIIINSKAVKYNVDCLCSTFFISIASIFKLQSEYSTPSNDISFYIHIVSLSMLCLFLVKLFLSASNKISINKNSNSKNEIICIIFYSSFLLICIFQIITNFLNKYNSISMIMSITLQSYNCLIFSALLWVGYGYMYWSEATQIQSLLEIKQTFVRSVSHEIRTPLNIVLMGLKLLKVEISREDFNEEPVSTLIEDIESSCDISIRILSDLLDYEKLESGIMDIEKSEMILWPFVLDVIKPFRIQARQLGVELICWNHEEALAELGSCTIEGDKHKLGQIIRNFVSNALKFTPAGGRITIKASIKKIPRKSTSYRNIERYLMFNKHKVASTVTFSPDSHDASVVHLQVTDTGYGIASENISKLFNEVVQFNASALQNGGGSGLGLWIARSIAELHGGNVSVYSEGEGKGSTFTLELPIVSKNSERQASKPLLDAISDAGSEFFETQIRVAEGVETSSLNVLVVDDSAINRRMLCRLIYPKFRTVLEAEDGAKALEIVQQRIGIMDQKIDVILMDSVMPNMDGPTATREIRSLGYCGLIIGVTGDTIQGEINNFLYKGANAVVLKPLKIEKLENIINELCSAQKKMCD